MSDKTLESIGKVLTGSEERDAVHFAVAPMVAAEKLAPGTHVGTDGHGRISKSGPHIGIVDPFLKAPVVAGTKVWLMLYPGTITSLRHEWAHPAFASGERPATAKATSEAWMRKWAMEHVSEDYYGEADGKFSEDVAYAFAIRAGHEHYIGPYESARDHIDSEWWSHWENITGERGERDAYFSCSC